MSMLQWVDLFGKAAVFCRQKLCMTEDLLINSDYFLAPVTAELLSNTEVS